MTDKPNRYLIRNCQAVKGFEGYDVYITCEPGWRAYQQDGKVYIVPVDPDLVVPDITVEHSAS